MNSDKLLKNWFWMLIEFPRNTLPNFIIKFANPEVFYTDKMLKQITPVDKLKLALDAGAGDQNKKEYLINKGYTYESCDFEEIFSSDSADQQTYICRLDHLPMSGETYDLIICVQVLEHVSNPVKSIDEMFRVLKPGGLIYLSTNFMYPRHGIPYDFFRFSEDGLIHLFDNSGFHIEQISAHGGFPAFCAQIMHEVPFYIRNFIIFGHSNPTKTMRFRSKRAILLIFSIAPLLALNLITQLLAILCHALDRLDKNQRYTLGYSVIARKLN